MDALPISDAKTEAEIRASIAAMVKPEQPRAPS
jgi:hypothetical protein